MIEVVVPVVVEAKHIDGGEHASFLAPQMMALDVHAKVLTERGLGLEHLKAEHNLFLLVPALQVNFRGQLYLGERLDAHYRIKSASPVRIECTCVLHKEGKPSTAMEWKMAVIQFGGTRPLKIPDWMLGILGKDW